LPWDRQVVSGRLNVGKFFGIIRKRITFAVPKIKLDQIMAKKSKDQRIQVILECTEQKGSGVPGMSRYITTKNKKNTPDRLEKKKYNPYLKKVTLHKEIK
jgi:large subunit ribosomal protein L33